jgi:Dimethlysulfonioproprionate lyase
LIVQERLAERMREIIAGRQSPITRPFLDEWPRGNQIIERKAAVLPVLRWLPELLSHTRDPIGSLTSLLIEHARVLDWRQTYAADDFGPEFLQRYGWTEIIGQRGALASDLIAAGFLMLGPDVEYPFHSHDAEEIYVPLSGVAEWARGAEGWRRRRPGELINHPSRTAHAIRTADDPLLAMYVWRAGNLTQKSAITRS